MCERYGRARTAPSQGAKLRLSGVQPSGKRPFPMSTLLFRNTLSRRAATHGTNIPPVFLRVPFFRTTFVTHVRATRTALTGRLHYLGNSASPQRTAESNGTALLPTLCTLPDISRCVPSCSKLRGLSAPHGQHSLWPQWKYLTHDHFPPPARYRFPLGETGFPFAREADPRPLTANGGSPPQAFPTQTQHTNTTYNNTHPYDTHYHETLGHTGRRPAARHGNGE